MELCGSIAYFADMGLRQEKFSKQIQRDLGEIFQLKSREWFQGEFITISAVRVTPDLSFVRVYLSLFNAASRSSVMENVELHSREIRKELAKRLKNQVRKIPEIAFFEDDTLDYVSKMDKLFEDLNKEKKNEENPED